MYGNQLALQVGGQFCQLKTRFAQYAFNLIAIVLAQGRF